MGDGAATRDETRACQSAHGSLASVLEEGPTPALGALRRKEEQATRIMQRRPLPHLT
jgi:hypothetical protein